MIATVFPLESVTAVVAAVPFATETGSFAAEVVPLATEAGSLGMVRSAVAMALLLVGAFFLTVGTVGLLRLPDVYNRMHATTKATTLGASSVFLAGFVVFGPGGAGLTSLVGIVFLFLTAPTGAHLISRAAHRMGVPLHGEDATWPDEVED